MLLRNLRTMSISSARLKSIEFQEALYILLYPNASKDNIKEFLSKSNQERFMITQKNWNLKTTKDKWNDYKDNYERYAYYATYEKELDLPTDSFCKKEVEKFFNMILQGISVVDAKNIIIRDFNKQYIDGRHDLTEEVERIRSYQFEIINAIDKICKLLKEKNIEI